MESNNNGQEKVIDLIRKCLALANSPNEYEAAAAMAKAQELLDKYNLSLAQVSLEERKAPELTEGDVSYDQRWEVTLFGGVAKENCCRIIFSHHGKTISILGRFPNVVATYEMGSWLVSQLSRIALTAQGEYNEYRLRNDVVVRGASSRQYRIDFLLGMASRVIERLKELNVSRRDVIPNMNALVLDLKKETDDFFKSKYPRTTGSSYRASRSGGYSAGIKAGDGVSIVPPSRHVSSDAGRYLGSGS